LKRSFQTVRCPLLNFLCREICTKNVSVDEIAAIIKKLTTEMNPLRRIKFFMWRRDKSQPLEDVAGRADRHRRRTTRYVRSRRYLLAQQIAFHSFSRVNSGTIRRNQQLPKPIRQFETRYSVSTHLEPSAGKTTLYAFCVACVTNMADRQPAAAVKCLKY
jgi:hypothetical protein